MRLGIAFCYAFAHNVSMKTATEILNALKEAGLSQMEISRQSGIPQPRISRWQKGCVPVGANDALRLMSMLAKAEANEQSQPQRQTHPAVNSTPTD